MKMTVNQPVEISVDSIRCVLAIRYDEEDMPNDYPLRKGDVWDVTIDIATGQIRDWPAAGAEPLELGAKICDEGSYYLMNGPKVVAGIEQDYVPSCIPSEYGDYVDFNIDATGKITNWKFDANKAKREFFPGNSDD